MKNLREIIKETRADGLTRTEKQAVEAFAHFAAFPDMFEALTSTRGQLPEKIIKDYLRQFQDVTEYRKHFNSILNSSNNEEL